MPEFPHLQLRRKLEGDHKPKKLSIASTPNATTLDNLNQRQVHGGALLTQLDHLQNFWAEQIQKRQSTGLPSIAEPEIIPILLQIDPDDFKIESLKSFGIEIISEEEDGYIIGASSDNFKSLREKIDLFLKNEPNKNFRDKAAQLWRINEGLNWKLEHVLSQELMSKWDQITDEDVFILDIGVACHVRISDQPSKTADITEARYQKTLERWEHRKENLLLERDKKADERQQSLLKLVRDYGGELISDFIEYPDSFCCRIKINGKGLKDLVLTYQYLFEVIEYDPYTYHDGVAGDFEQITTEVTAPIQNSVSVCVIDSGIQEGHKLLQPAILSKKSKSYVPSDVNVADVMPNGGHGTRVAGSILYPKRIPRTGSYQLPCFIENARILKYSAGNVIIPEELYPPQLMEKILKDFEGTRLFNLSINSYRPCKTTHMSQWASAIDKLMHEQGVLFIVSAGNISRQSGSLLNPGIKEHIDSGRNYPAYLLENACRIGSPGQSCFALTVGSICTDEYEDDDLISFGKKDSPSSFSRTGLGIWRMIKPDVVEYGGDFARTKTTPVTISIQNRLSPETVRATAEGGFAIGNDSVGTSYSAPKVSHIAAALASEFPDESINVYRALIAQSARLPNEKYRNPSINDIRHFGYGVPDIERATRNTPQRITFYSSDVVKPKQTCIYSVNIPSELSRPGEEYDILMEVTLAYMAEPRRTRRKTNSYLSHWLSWDSSKLNESFEQFSSRVIKEIDSPESNTDDQQTIKWMIRENPQWSKVEGLRRQDSTLQKSWCIMKSYDLPHELCLAVTGHKGWESDLEVEIEHSIAVSFEVLNADINLYELVRAENEIQQKIEVVG